MEDIFEVYEREYIERHESDKMKFNNMLAELKTKKNIRLEEPYIREGVLYYPFFDSNFGNHYKFKLCFDQFGIMFPDRVIFFSMHNAFGGGYIYDQIYTLTGKSDYERFVDTAKYTWKYTKKND